MANNFYPTNNEILKLNPLKGLSDEIKAEIFKNTDTLDLFFNQFITRSENLERINSNLEKGTFKLSYPTIEKEFNITRGKAQRLVKRFVDMEIIEPILITKIRGESSIYAYISVYGNDKQSDKQNDKQSDKQKPSDCNDLSDINDKETINKTINKTISNKKSTKKENKKEVIYSDSFTKIYDLWNSKKIVPHRGMKDYMVVAYDKAKKEFNDEQIAKAINNYDKLLKDESFYYTHTFTLEKFLGQKNGIGSFIDTDGYIYLDYLNQKEKTPSGKGEFKNNIHNGSICKTNEKDSYKSKFKGEWL